MMSEEEEEQDHFQYAVGGGGDGEEVRRNSIMFSELKDCCLQLLHLLQNPNNHHSSAAAVDHLHQFLRRSSPDDLQPFFDYILFPLLLLLDAAVSCRSTQKIEPEEKCVMPGAFEKPHKVSDAVAEGVLHCLEELLRKCHSGSKDQMVVLLKKLTCAALLSPSEAAEEFRVGVIRCFQALILGLYLCSNESCSCKQVNGLPALFDGSELESPLSGCQKYKPESECLPAFLRSLTLSPAVGHWLSLLLKAADIEVARGHRGSAKLRSEAFLALRLLVARVGTADALAFFLPGVVSQFGKVLLVSKTMISGAAGSMKAMDEAIRGLAEFLMIVLEDEANVSGLEASSDNCGLHSNAETSSLAFLEELRKLPGKKLDQAAIVLRDSGDEIVDTFSSKSGYRKDVLGSLRVDRTKDWIITTSAHVDKLLSASFPHLCVHPSVRVRRGLLAAVQGLLSKCSYTLKSCRLMLMECLCALACDEDDDLSASAQQMLKYLFSPQGKLRTDFDTSDIFNRLFAKLPQIVMGREESLAVSHAEKLLVLIYFSGPQLVKNLLLQSPVTAARFFDTFALCLSQNSSFAGPLDKLLLERPSSSGYLRSIVEMKAITSLVNDNKKATMDSNPSDSLNLPGFQSISMLSTPESMQNEYDLPRMPPWFSSVGSQKLYLSLARIIRLVGLSLISDSQSEGCLSIIKDIPLDYFRKMVSEVRMKEYSRGSWQSWYRRTGSGQIVRRASTAACILNEMLFGLSIQSVDSFARLFRHGGHQEIHSDVTGSSAWKVCLEKSERTQLVDCVGSVLHEYLSPEVWNLPLDPKTSLQDSDIDAGDIHLHFFHDNAMLQQVVIDGIGIFNLILKEEFLSSGFLHLSLYVLLENLICSNFQVRSAADAVLRIISATSGYPSVGHLVLANSDYVIDSICRQLRHLDLNPQVASLLAALLSYIGVAHKILPLLEEPMRCAAQELEILGRHQHPELTIPFLKAVGEISKASQFEACSLTAQAQSFLQHVNSIKSEVENETKEGGCPGDFNLHMEQYEAVLFKLNDSKRYRRTVGSITGSCLTAATPLLASMKQAQCLVALKIIEDSFLALAKVEEAYKIEKEAKRSIGELFELYSFHNLRDSLDADEYEPDENRLLPAMNKVWPYLVACVRNRNPVVVQKCCHVISSLVLICKGDFFSRRFITDGTHFWKLLSTSPFQRKSVIPKEERSPLLLPYRSNSLSSEESRAEITDLKVQAAVLNMIADLSRNKKSASALEAVLKKVCGIVVGIACSGVVGLRDASVNALEGLASMDPDLVWLLLADVYYSLTKDAPSPPTTGLPEIFHVLPPPSTPKCYLYVQYGGQSYGFDIDVSSVDIVFKKLFL